MNNQGDLHILRPHRLPVPATKRHLCLSRWPDPHPQTVSGQRSRRDLCRSTGGLRSLHPQGALYSSFPAFVTRHRHEAALQGMDQRATPEVMRLRRSTVEHPLATLKYRVPAMGCTGMRKKEQFELSRVAKIGRIDMRMASRVTVAIAQSTFSSRTRKTMFRTAPLRVPWQSVSPECRKP